MLVVADGYCLELGGQKHDLQETLERGPLFERSCRHFHEDKRDVIVRCDHADRDLFRTDSCRLPLDGRPGPSFAGNPLQDNRRSDVPSLHRPGRT